MDSEAQAAEYRRMMTARSENKRLREAALIGSPSDRARVYDAWEPIMKRDTAGWTAPQPPLGILDD